MTIWNPSSWFNREKKESASGVAISAFGAGQPVWSTRDYEAFAKESYIQNAIAFRCIAMTAQAAASIPVLLNGKSGKVLDSHKVLDLLAKPTPGHTFEWLIEATATYLQIAGNAYIEAVGPDRKGVAPKELWTLRPDRMKVIAGEQGMPAGYQYEANGAVVKWDVDPIDGHSNILHIKKFHPIDDWYGLSAVEPAAYAVDRHNEAGAHNMAVLQNGATPSGAMIFKPVKGPDGDQSAPKDIIQAAEKRLNERYSGSRNAGRPLVLGGNVDWQSFGMTMEELQLTESKLDAARDICAAFGVPIELLLPGNSTYNNKREAKLGFYEETVLPLHNRIFGHLNGWLLPRFGEDLELVPDLDNLEPLSLRREIRQENTVKLYESGLITRDEGRTALQYDPQPEMPQRKIDAQTLTALVNAAEHDEAMYGPLFRYLFSVGLIDKSMTMETFLSNAADIMAGLNDEDETELIDDASQDDA